VTRRPPVWLRALAAVAVVSAATGPTARAQADSVAGGGTVVSGIVGRAAFDNVRVTILGLDFTDIAFGRLAAHASVATWLQAVEAGGILIDFEGGPLFATRLFPSGAVGVYGGMNVLLVVAGNRPTAAPGAHLGAVVMAAMGPSTWLRISLSRRWYGAQADIPRATVVTLGLGFRVP
jgi:hypothetical protein